MAMTTYVKSRLAFTRCVEIKSLCLQFKRSGTEYAAQKVNFLTSVAKDRPPPLSKVSLGSYELLPFHFFITSTCPAHDVTNFIDFD